MARTLSFTDDELKRIRSCTFHLGTTYEEFIHAGTIAAVEECETTLIDAYRRPMTNRELDEMVQRLDANGASGAYTLAWLRREMARIA